jgi:hypothetical protein
LIKQKQQLAFGFFNVGIGSSQMRGGTLHSVTSSCTHSKVFGFPFQTVASGSSEIGQISSMSGLGSSTIELAFGKLIKRSSEISPTHKKKLFRRRALHFVINECSQDKTIQQIK